MSFIKLIITLISLNQLFTINASVIENSIKNCNPDYNPIKNNLTGHTNSVYSLAILNNGYLASSSYASIFIWNPKDGSIKSKIKSQNGPISSLSVLPNGNLASGSGDKSIIIRNPNDQSNKIELLGHTNYINALTFTKRRFGKRFC